MTFTMKDEATAGPARWLGPVRWLGPGM